MVTWALTSLFALFPGLAFWDPLPRGLDMQCPHWHISPGHSNLPPLSPRFGLWILLRRHNLDQLIWLNSNGCLRVNAGLPLPEPHLDFTRPVFSVLFRQARDSCAPFGAPVSVLHLSAASRMLECSLKGTFVPVKSWEFEGWAGVGLGTEEGWREVGVVRSPTPAIPNSRKRGWPFHPDWAELETLATKERILS